MYIERCKHGSVRGWCKPAIEIWQGGISLLYHNRGSKYALGFLENLPVGTEITYTTVYGTRTYSVTSVEIIVNNDWSCLQATSDNRITITTCLANHPESRVVVRAEEIAS